MTSTGDLWVIIFFLIILLIFSTAVGLHYRRKYEELRIEKELRELGYTKTINVCLECGEYKMEQFSKDSAICKECGCEVVIAKKGYET